MGMYTELHLWSELKKDTPIEVVSILKYMLGEVEEEPILPEHPLFATSRWSWMLRSDSYYFDADTHSTLRFDEPSEAYYLNIRCNLKNYTGEIEKFVNWIMPYLQKYDGEFIGFSRYEENNDPNLLYYDSRI